MTLGTFNDLRFLGKPPSPPQRRAPKVPLPFDEAPDSGASSRRYPRAATMRPATTIVILILVLLIAIAGIVFVVQLLSV